MKEILGVICLNFIMVMISLLYEGGPPQKKPELSSGGQAPCSTGFLLGECSRNPSVSMYQLVVVWEAAFSFSELFLKTLSTLLPISWWVIYEHTCPHHTECWAVFDQNWHEPCVPHFLFTQSCPERLFFISPDEKVLKEKHVEEVKQQTAEALKGIKIDEFKNCFWTVEKMFL